MIFIWKKIRIKNKKNFSQKDKKKQIKLKRTSYKNDTDEPTIEIISGSNPKIGNIIGSKTPSEK